MLPGPATLRHSQKPCSTTVVLFPGQPRDDVPKNCAVLLSYCFPGQPPSAFPQDRMRIQWRGGAYSPPSGRWTQLLDGLLEPVAEDRLTAAEALTLLSGKGLSQSSRPQDPGLGRDTNVVVGGSNFARSRRKKTVRACLPSAANRTQVQTGSCLMC